MSCRVFYSTNTEVDYRSCIEEDKPGLFRRIQLPVVELLEEAVVGTGVGGEEAEAGTGVDGKAEDGTNIKTKPTKKSKTNHPKNKVKPKTAFYVFCC